MEEKKKRGHNYTEAEKEILLELINKYKNVIENKETNAQMLMKKRKAWGTVCQQYNAVAVSGHRTWQQLRHLYENIKQKSKKNIADINVKKSSNGGESCGTMLTKQDAQVLPMVEPQIQPLSDSYDDAAVSFDNEASISKQEEEDPPSVNLKTIKTETIVDQDTDPANESFTQSSKPCTESRNQNDTAQELMGTTDSNKPSTSTSDLTGQMKCKTCRKNYNLKQQYFKSKIRNAKLEYQFLLNKNQMQINMYKVEMKILKHRLNKLKYTDES